MKGTDNTPDYDEICDFWHHFQMDFTLTPGVWNVIQQWYIEDIIQRLSLWQWDIIRQAPEYHLEHC